MIQWTNIRLADQEGKGLGSQQAGFRPDARFGQVLAHLHDRSGANVNTEIDLKSLSFSRVETISW